MTSNQNSVLVRLWKYGRKGSRDYYGPVLVHCTVGKKKNGLLRRQRGLGLLVLIMDKNLSDFKIIRLISEMKISKIYRNIKDKKLIKAVLPQLFQKRREHHLCHNMGKLEKKKEYQLS
jgi:hypothetical protein